MNTYAHVSQPDPDRTLPTERATKQEPMPTATTQATSSSSTLSRSLGRTDQQSRTYGRLELFKVHSPIQPVSSAQLSQGALKLGDRPRSQALPPRRGPSTSNSRARTDGRTNSVDFATSDFSFHVPNRTSYSVHGVSQNDNDRRLIPTGYRPDSVRSTQTSAQVSAVPPQPST